MHDDAPADHERKDLTVEAPLRGWADLRALQALGKGLRFANRFTPPPESLALVEGLIRYARNHCVSQIGPSSAYYRARKVFAPYGQSPKAFPCNDMGAPPPSIATSGRLSPSGIPVLYLATDAKTAVAELRPWRGASFTVATFRLRTGISVVDLRHSWVAKEDESAEEMVWDTVGRAFSLPWDDEDLHRYLDTQYLATAFKEAGFEGALYNSAMNPDGHNLVLFDPPKAECGEVQLVTVESVTRILTS